jgi:arginine deiminase
MFKSAEFHFYCGKEDRDYERDYEWTSVEGGDVLVLGNQTVLIGISERTSAQGVVFLAKQLFKAKQAERIIAVQLPKERSCMHLDTVLTQIDRDCFSYYDKVLVLNKKLPLWELRPGKNLGEVESVHLRKSVKEAIEDALNLRKVRWIKTGGDKYQAEREQWNDANNLLAIRPGVVVAYNHNTSTIKKLEREGVKVVTIPGEDLGRGRGGPRCMSCPIERETL